MVTIKKKKDVSLREISYHGPYCFPSQEEIISLVKLAREINKKAKKKK